MFEKKFLKTMEAYESMISESDKNEIDRGKKKSVGYVISTIGGMYIKFDMDGYGLKFVKNIDDATKCKNEAHANAICSGFSNIFSTMKVEKA